MKIDDEDWVCYHWASLSIGQRWEIATHWYGAALEREAKRYQYRTGPRYGQQLADARKAGKP